MSDIKQVKLNGRDLKCLNCGNNKFTEVGIKLNSTKAVFFDLELFEKGGKSYICSECGFNHEFFKKKSN